MVCSVFDKDDVIASVSTKANMARFSYDDVMHPPPKALKEQQLHYRKHSQLAALLSNKHMYLDVSVHFLLFEPGRGNLLEPASLQNSLRQDVSL